MLMITVFTDGSSRGNPGPGGYGAIIVSNDNVLEIGGRDDSTTNNRMELTAVIEALESILKENEINIYTDSAYVVSGITRWVKGWQRNNWRTSGKEEVLNRDLWQRLLDLTFKKIINWKLIKGHSGTEANERCDEIATSFADNNTPLLYNGPKNEYTVSFSVVNDISKPKSKSKSKAYSYVSFVNGEIRVHKTWQECKARVSGVSGAKYKKTTSPQNEIEVINEFTK